MNNKTNSYDNDIHFYTTDDTTQDRIPQNLGTLSMMDRYVLTNYTTRKTTANNDIKIPARNITFK